MKKLTTIILAAAMMLSLSACGKDAEGSSADSGEQLSAVEEDTSKAEEGTSSPAEESAPAEESSTSEENAASESAAAEEEAAATQESVVYEDLPQLEGEVTLLSELSFGGGTLVTAYDDVLLVRGEDQKYGLVNKAGEPLTDMIYSSCHWDYSEDKSYFALKRWGEHVEYGDYGYDPTFVDVYDEDGNKLYSDIYDYTNGIIVTKTYTEFQGAMDQPAAVYTFTDEDTGEVIFTFDEHEYGQTHSDAVNVMASFAVGKDGCVIWANRAPTELAYDIYFIARDKVVNVKDVVSQKVSGDFKLSNSSVLYSDSGCMNICYMLFGVDEYGNERMESQEYVMYDLLNERFIEYVVPDAENYPTIANVFGDKQIIVYNGYGDHRNKLLLADHSGNVLLRDVNDGWLHTDADNYKDYMGFINDEGAGYCSMDGSDTFMYDDATVFAGEYAFVVKDGMGYFINRRFEAVTTSIPATGAIIYEHSDIIYLAAQNKYYIYG